MIELAVGCNHMTCRCGNHFCFKCGGTYNYRVQICQPNHAHTSAPWDIENYRCTRNPSCELWEDDDMLLDEDARGGAQQVLPHAPLPQPPPSPPPPPAARFTFHAAPPPYEGRPAEFYWITNAGIHFHCIYVTHFTVMTCRLCRLRPPVYE